MVKVNQETITEGENGWAYTYSSLFGDWRGIHEARGLRTRLKRSLTMAQQDVKDGRLQRRVKGEWVDRIDGARR